MALDARLVAALQGQLRHREALLRSGARRVGWKLGMGKRERIGDHIAIGYLTTATLIEPGGRFSLAPGRDHELHVDTELCVDFANDVDRGADAEAIRAAIGHCWPALEIVDLARRAGEPESIVVDNVFHRAVAVGDEPVPLACAEQVTTYVNGECADREPWPVDVPDRLVAAAALLAAVNERITAGDRVITGSISQLPLAAGNTVRGQFGSHASVVVRATATTTPP
ncbi:MAG: hypothetical protein JO321_13545 [Solirubrobacterales bacterium]|nr:hypothetical protein [Solirubrobacterales bacterium]